MLPKHLPLDIIELAVGTHEFVSLPLCSGFTYTRQHHQISQIVNFSPFVMSKGKTKEDYLGVTADKCIFRQLPCFWALFYSPLVREYPQQHRQNPLSILPDKATLRNFPRTGLPYQAGGNWHKTYGNI